MRVGLPGGVVSVSDVLWKRKCGNRMVTRFCTFPVITGLQLWSGGSSIIALPPKNGKAMGEACDAAQF